MPTTEKADTPSKHRPSAQAGASAPRLQYTLSHIDCYNELVASECTEGNILLRYNQSKIAAHVYYGLVLQIGLVLQE